MLFSETSDTPARVCGGDGSCFTQDDYGDYTIQESCVHACRLLECPNFIVCEQMLPSWVIDCNDGTCPHCAIDMWELEISKEKLECPICLETTICITLKNCKHAVCAECFKRCYRTSDQSYEPRPVQPYPDEVMDEYYDFIPIDRQKEMIELYPLITAYDEAVDRWEENEAIMYQNEENLRLCPLCRK